MTLPKIEYPSFEVTIPSSKKRVRMRMMLVKEEKILLMAKESTEPFETIKSIKQVVNNCLVDQIDVNKLAVFDLEYMFLKLRAASIDNIAKVSYRDNEDDKVYDFEIDLSKVEVNFPENVSNNIKITDSIGVVMHYPLTTIYENKELINPDTGETNFDKLVVACIDSIYDGDKFTKADTVSNEELSQFVETIGVKAYQEIRNYLITVPTLKHEIKYKNELGNDRTIRLTTLDDFFTLR